MTQGKESLREPELNVAYTTGRLVTEPEVNEIPSGSVVCNFTILNKRTYKTKAGDKKEDKVFIQVAVWGAQAEYLGEKLKKGRPVLVTSHLKQSDWVDKHEQKRSTISLEATWVQILTHGHFDDEPEAKPADPDDVKF